MQAQVFWDGFALNRPYSGICVYATRLAHALRAQSCQVGIVGAEKPAKALQDFAIASRRRGLLDSCWPKVWGPCFNFHYLKQHIIKPPTKFVYHGLANFNLPLWGAKPSHCAFVLTVHDLIPLLAGGMISRRYAWEFSMLLKRAALRADRIITVSQWTYDTFLNKFPHWEQKLLLIPNGHHFNDDPEIIPKMSADKKVLSIVRYEPYKRLNLIVQVAEQLPKPWSFDVVTDKRGVKYFENSAQKMMQEGRLRVHTQLKESELTYLYRQASFYWHPSLYEGFCLPVAEAQRYGLFVLYTQGSAIEETVLGQWSLGLASTASVDDWLAALQQVDARVSQMLTDAQIEKIKHEWRSKNTWNQTAKSLKLTYESLFS